MKPFFAVGHSNRELEFFIGLLLGYGVTHLADVRTIPHSRHNPQFNRESLPENLKKVGIAYSHWPELGGLRKPRPDSLNDGWKNSSFRGYADYMQTIEFGEAIERFMALGKKETIVFMCAEAVPWRCHRSLIADALLARRIPVHQIMSRVSAPLHKITSWARVEGSRVTYPADSQQPELHL
jgi:uncharacterized protein (DUF488 family)